MPKTALLFLALSMAAPALGAEAPAASGPAAAAPAKEAPLKLAGRWGIGFDSIPGASTGTGLVPGLASPNALAVRYWINETLAWDGLLAAELSSQPEGGTGSGGVAAGTDRRAWGVGTVFKFNLRRPTRWLLAQAQARASLAQLRDVDNGGSGLGQTTTTFSVGAAAGFEAFLPVWDALSVEGSVGLDFSSSQTKADGAGQAAQSGSSLRVGANGFTPVSLSIHLYF